MKLPFFRQAPKATEPVVKMTWLENKIVQPQNIVTQPEDPWRRYVTYIPRSPAGVRVTVDTAFQVSAVWACIDVIAKALASQTWQIFERLSNGDRKLLPDDPLAYLLNVRANPEMTAISFREATMIAALSWGNGYAEIERDMAQRPAALWPIAPDRVECKRDPQNRLIYRVHNDRGDWQDLDQADVLHIKGPGITGLIGDNVIAKAIHTIGLTMAAERFGETYFGNGAEIGGVLQTTQKLDDATYNHLKESWNTRHRGPNQAFHTAILDNGLEWKPSTTDAEKAQLVAIRSFQIAEVCRWFGVPPHKIADLSRATNNNIEHQGLEFVRDALSPWARRNEQEVDYKLFSARGRPRFSRIDLEPLSQGDAQARANYYKTMTSIGAYSPNDVLKMEGKNPIGPAGDIRTVSAQLIRLEDAGSNFAVANADDADSGGDSGSSPPEDGGAGAGSTQALTEAMQILFCSIYEQAARKRANRLADLQRNNKSDDEIAKAMEAFAVQQEPYLCANLAKPCETLGKIAKTNVIPAAFAAGHRVIRDQQTPQVAAAELIRQFIGV